MLELLYDAGDLRVLSLNLRVPRRGISRRRRSRPLPSRPHSSSEARLGRMSEGRAFGDRLRSCGDPHGQSGRGPQCRHCRRPSFRISWSLCLPSLARRRGLQAALRPAQSDRFFSPSASTGLPTSKTHVEAGGCPAVAIVCQSIPDRACCRHRAAARWNGTGCAESAAIPASATKHGAAMQIPFHQSERDLRRRSSFKQVLEPGMAQDRDPARPPSGSRTRGYIDRVVPAKRDGPVEVDGQPASWRTWDLWSAHRQAARPSSKGSVISRQRADGAPTVTWSRGHGPYGHIHTTLPRDRFPGAQQPAEDLARNSPSGHRPRLRTRSWLPTQSRIS